MSAPAAESVGASASAGERPRQLGEPFAIGGVAVPNRLLLAPLAGIGNWFVRLQAMRFGAGMAVSEMVSSHAIHYRNKRTLQELLRIDERERRYGPVAVQLFGADVQVMRSAAATVAAAGADLIDLNMGCPVPKVCRTGAGAALIDQPELAVALVEAAREGSGLPVTVKLRSGRRAGEERGLELAAKLVDQGGASAIAIHPRAASSGHAGGPDYALAAALAAELEVPVILSGGLRSAGRIRELFAQTGVAAVMLARGSFGNPWLFAQLADRRSELVDPSPAEIAAELDWLVARAAEHLGAERAARYLRKFYPWYVQRLGLARATAGSLLGELNQLRGLDQARRLIAALPVTAGA